MVIPETSGAADLKRRSPRAIVIGLLTLVAGLAVVFGLTQPDAPPAVDALPTTPTSVSPVEAPSTTTTTAPFRVADVATGPQIEWIGRQEFPGKPQVVDVIFRDGRFHMFTTRPPASPIWTNGGVDAWASTEGAQWESLGRIGPEFSPSRVIEAGPGFLAFGSNSNNQATAWLSTDGSEWMEVDLPVGLDTSGTWFPGSFGVSDEAIVLIGSEWSDPVQTAVDRIIEEHFPGLRGHVNQLGVDRRDRLFLFAPLNIPVAVRDPEEFGLPSAHSTITRYQTVAYIGTPDGLSWRRVTLGTTEYGSDTQSQHGISEMSLVGVGPDGRFWGRAYSAQTARWQSVASADGENWEPLRGVQIPDLVVSWEGRWLDNNSYSGNPIVRLSDDLESWQTLTSPSVLPPNLRWGDHYPNQLAAGPGGMALAVRSVEATETTGTDMLSMERDGYTLQVRATGDVSLMRGESQVASGDQWLIENQDFPVRLIAGGTAVMFTDPDTGEDLVAFTLAELADLESNLYQSSGFTIDVDRHALFFSPDGENWTVQDLGEIVHGDAWTRLAIGEDRLLVILNHPGLTEVWTGDLPD